jgi:hypothetical protein
LTAIAVQQPETQAQLALQCLYRGAGQFEATSGIHLACGRLDEDRQDTQHLVLLAAQGQQIGSATSEAHPLRQFAFSLEEPGQRRLIAGIGGDDTGTRILPDRGTIPAVAKKATGLRQQDTQQRSVVRENLILCGCLGHNPACNASKPLKF